MTSRTFQPARLHGRALVPPAKSEAQRALLLSALGQGQCRLHGFTPPLCEDVQAMINGITALGATVRHMGDTLVVQAAPAAQTAPQGGTFHVYACATALRMLIPVFWARGQAVRITMADSLLNRPMEAFMPLAEQAGTTLTGHPSGGSTSAWMQLSGKMNAGSYQVDGSLSSQFASGLLVALAHGTDQEGNPAPSRLKVTPPLVSRPYLDMTLGLMKQFGIPVQEKSEGTFSLNPMGRSNPTDMDIPGDWSQGAVLLCANAMGSGVAIRNLRRTSGGRASLQGDAQILSILREMGMLVVEKEDELYVTCPSRAELSPLIADCSDIPDLAPILALTCTQAHGKSTLSGVRRLRVKECDRLRATVEILNKLGAKARLSADEDALFIQGPTPLKGGFLADSRGDHRVVMMLAMAALIAQRPITVSGVEALDKSWPGFLETYEALGGKAL